MAANSKKTKVKQDDVKTVDVTEAKKTKLTQEERLIKGESIQKEIVYD